MIQLTCESFLTGKSKLIATGCWPVFFNLHKKLLVSYVCS